VNGPEAQESSLWLKTAPVIVGRDMVKPFLDLRTPLLAAISSRLSCRQAATRFGVSAADNFDIVSNATGAIR
jgi:hypothetical protein